jgi:SNF2 family DNA or RNA helicase/predicted RNA methylase
LIEREATMTEPELSTTVLKTEYSEILDDTGKEANKDLNFRLWSRSRHAQYFTSLRIANLIFSMVSLLLPAPEAIKKLKVLDPTCGTGRLLYPFKRKEAQVIGIELDKEVSDKARQLLGTNSVRQGSILEYAQYLTDKFDIAVINPPYGILFNQDETEFELEGLSYARNIESQNATLQIAHKALTGYNGLLFAIIPTSSFDNAKDNSLRQYLYKNFTVLLRVTLNNLFKEEYGIEVKTDLVVCKIKGYDQRTQQTPYLILEANDPMLEDKVLRDWKPIAEANKYHPYDLSDYVIQIPFLNNLVTITTSTDVEITTRGLRGDPSALAMMDFYNDTLSFYSPVVGKPTGLKDAFLEPPALCKRGIDRAEQILTDIGFALTITDATRTKIEALKEKFKLLSIPLYPPKEHQLLAYFDEKEYTARADVYDTIEDSDYRQAHRDNGNGKEPVLIFKRGKKYYIRPSWVRAKEFVGIEVIGEGKDQKTITTEIDRGYLSFEINTEQGNREFREPEPLEIALLLEAFEVPDVKDIAEERPGLVKMWKKKLLQKYSFLHGEFEYQAEDLSRVLAKTKSAYFGYDMGGGKSSVSMVFNHIRNVKRVLVVCQSSLIENWINEANKFGFKAQRLTTHESITLLQRAIDSKTESSGTTFYITSYEFLSLDTGRRYDPWTCIKYDKDGNEKHHVEGNTSRTCQGCSTEYSFTQRQCPKCASKDNWTGENCTKCGYSAYSYSATLKQYPAYKRIKKLFRSVIIDESQQAKSKTSFRGQAVRAIHAKSRLELTGTLMKGYITDTFFNLGYITRHNNPLFPYRFDRRGSKLFAEEFSTFEFKDIQYEDTLHKGRKRELPEVSNLNRFWKILGTCTIRRLKDEMVDLPPKTRRVMALTLDPAHASEYGFIVEEAKKKIDREMRKREEEINMGVISKALWSMRFGATIPRISPDHNVKIQKAIEITQDALRKGEKVLVYSALREMQATLHQEFVKHGINHIFVPSTMQTKDRFKNIKKFQEDPNITAIVAGLNVLNRGFTITAANHVIFTDVEYSPESTDQAEDRAHRTGQEKPVTCHYLLIDWPDEKTNIDLKMYGLIGQKKKAIANAIDGKVRFGKTAQVLRAGGDYLALAKAINGEIEEPLDFEYEREGRKEVLAEIRVKEEVLAHDNGKWESLWKEVQEKKNGNGKDEKGVRVIHEKVNGQLTLFS